MGLGKDCFSGFRYGICFQPKDFRVILLCQACFCPPPITLFNSLLYFFIFYTGIWLPMTESDPKYLQQAREYFEAGDFDAALAELYALLWSNINDMEIHLLLWQVMEGKHAEQSRLDRLREAVHAPIVKPKIEPPQAAQPTVFPQAAPFSRPREATRFVVDKPIILVGHDNRNRFFAELATVENLSSKGATLLTHRSLALRDQVHLFSPSGQEEEYVIALVRNLRKSHEDGRHRLGVEFLQKPGKWLYSDELMEAARTAEEKDDDEISSTEDPQAESESAAPSVSSQA